MPKKFRSLQEVLDLHGLAPIVGTVLIRHKNHPDGDAGIREHRRIVPCPER